VNFEEIKELVDIISDKNVSEFELERAGIKLRISKNQPVAAAAAAPTPVISLAPQAVGGGAPAPAAAPQPAAPAAATAESAPAPAEAEEEGLLAIKSPMVGTFYAAPSPDSPAYVKEGDSVSPGKVLCIVEAMKLMNEIESEVAGTIAKVHVENGQPVEFGETLFSIRPR
jgi:acetyl-CoA carboxylase biotin carboxyl carrier protein